MTSRAVQKKRTRARIVRRASSVFAREGFAGTSTARIAQSTGLSHGALFIHFPSRDDLVEEVSREFARAMTDRLHGLSETGASLRSVLRTHLECVGEVEGLYTRFVAEGALLPAPARASWTGLQSAIAHHIAAALAPEFAQGRVRQVPAHLFFNTWIGLLHHYLMNRDLFSPGRSVIEEKGDELLDFFAGLFEP